MNDLDFMRLALEEGKKGGEKGEIPIGALLVQEGRILAVAHNWREESHNPLHHAEIRVLEESGSLLGDWRLSDSTLYVTVEPCLMCLGALFQARVGRLIFGCTDPKREDPFPSLQSGSSMKANNHTLTIVGGVLEEECVALLKDFFQKRRVSE